MTFILVFGGVRIHYVTVGEGPPVVLLHGAAGGRSMWRHAGYIDGLYRFRCVLVDSRAHRGAPRERASTPARVRGGG
jgi:pimeloyl-ACP methyl ester carboxylesterase